MSGVIKTEDLTWIPSLLDTKQTYALDYGCSMIKVVYKEKTNVTEDPNKCCRPVHLKLAIFRLGDDSALSAFLEQNAESVGNGEVNVTGMGKRFNPPDNSTVRVTNLWEFDCFVKALRVILPAVPKQHLFYTLPKEEFNRAYIVAEGFFNMKKETKKSLGEYECMGFPHECSGEIVTTCSLPDVDLLYSSYNDGDIVPAIIVMCSSGISVIKYTHHDKPAQKVDYSPRGGSTLMGLGALLTGAKSFSELMSLAANGNTTVLDTYVKDVQGEEKDDFYAMFPDDMYCGSFNKWNNKTRDQVSAVDLAASVVMHVCNDLSHLAVNHAISSKITNVILCGTMVTHPVIQKAVTYSFLSRSLCYPPEIRPKLRMCTLGPYLGAIGAWITGIEHEKSSTPTKDNNEEKMCT